MVSTSRRVALVAGMLALGLAGCSNNEGPVSASTSSGGSTKSDLTARSEAALNDLYAKNPATKQLGEKAKAILVFPDILKAGLVIGGQGGNGTMFQNGKAVGFYNIAGGSFGFQAGVQEFSQAYFFNTEEALKTFRDTKGFQAGVGATAVAADFGANAALTSSTMQKPVVVATWGQAGIMAGATIEGAKITEINP
ncbi:MAG: YSC84-related protein [Geminicoccaceae bacterium]